MSAQFGLPIQTIEKMHAILGAYPAVQTAILYGSRAKGTHRPGSDIDLTVIGSGLSEPLRRQLATAFEEASIPYQVDLSLFDAIHNQELRAHILRVGKVFFTQKDTRV